LSIENAVLQTFMDRINESKREFNTENMSIAMRQMFSMNIVPENCIVNPMIEACSMDTHITIVDAAILLARFEIRFKQSAETMRVLYALIKIFLPAKNNFPTYSQAQTLLDAVGFMSLVNALRLTCCPNDCVIFEDSPQTTQMSNCPKCNAARY